MPAPSYFWSAEEHARAVALHASGASFAAIATALGRTRKAVGNRLIQHRADRPAPGKIITPWSAETDALIVRLSAEGIVSRDIAAQVGRTQSAVLQRLSILRSGTQMRLNGWTVWTDADRDRLREMWAADATHAAMAVALGRSKHSVVRQVFALRLPLRDQAVRRAALPKPVKIITKSPTARAIPPRASDTTGGAVPPFAAGAPAPTVVSREPVVPAPAPAVLSRAPEPVRLSRLTCSWVDGERGAWRPCEARAVLGKAFCPDHDERAYLPTKTLRYGGRAVR